MWRKTSKKNFIAFLTTLTLILGLIIPINYEKVYAMDEQAIETSNISNDNNLLDKKTIAKDKDYDSIKILGYEDNKELKNKVVGLLNIGKIKLSNGQDTITWEEIKKQLSVDDLDELVRGINKKIDIISFNDIHGSVQETKKNPGVAKLATEIKKYTNKNNEIYNSFIVSGGDMYQGSAMSNLKLGEPINKFAKEIGLIASAVGNHEFDWGTGNFEKWSQDGGFQFLAANLIDKKTNDIASFAKPYLVVERNGIKIGIIGLATPDTLYTTKPTNVVDYKFTSGVEEVNKYGKFLRDEEHVNAVVVITHMGAKFENGELKGESVDIAKSVEKGRVDAIVAAHDHRFTAGTVNGIKIAEGGCNGRGLGKLSFTFDPEGKLISVESSYDEVYKRKDDIKENEKVQAMVKDYEKDLEVILGEKISDLEIDLTNNKYNGVTLLGVTVCDAMKKITGSDIAITNGGGLRAPINKGIVTMGDLYTVLPFDNTLVTMELKGEDIIKIIDYGIDPKKRGWGQFSGVKVWYTPENEEGKRITSVRLEDGTKIEKDRYYKVVTNDFMAIGGDNYDFSKAKNVYNTNLVMRDEIKDLWKNEGINPKEKNVLVAGVDDTKEEVVSDTDNNKNDTVINEKENKETIINNKNSEVKNHSVVSKLPNTGAPFGGVLELSGLIAVTIGGYLTKKKKVS
ncbi:MAG: 5'-nucleotidase C-terminal domain-containing protein [Clostridium septicum]|uniref:5'-nucleotidase C-terminal domain-containing protein n=1 Tax=Clostridium septicum TaxID=1504 RepID=UPI002590837B|nr:5'-nucleotidase C-terminal domain-containing protein [Clostridium septicum]MDU1314115.1 5'-nucleotidase C-terminal domain-containing protein [Clostridium septicum]WLF70632.1 5'-nucleotidase C-terminal domain-containing protein [Clostridium septicum]